MITRITIQLLLLPLLLLLTLPLMFVMAWMHEAIGDLRRSSLSGGAPELHCLRPDPVHEGLDCR
jgi:hypothetical protein